MAMGSGSIMGTFFLLAGRKRKKCSTSTYVLSTDPTDLSRQGSSTLATLRSDDGKCFLV